VTGTPRMLNKLGWAGIGNILLMTALMQGALGAQPPSMAGSAAPPGEGQKAPDFSLEALDGAVVRLSAETARGPVVVVVLRGWPGYQCPFCTRQFGQYITSAADIEATRAHVLFVYPGPSDDLKRHAEAFTKATPLPSGYRVLLDPDYTFTRAWGLRWEAPGETAYPSTFVLDRRGTVIFARTSHSHGDRVPVADVLGALAHLRR
jgi:peroxiredoxin